jgi:hypothetical protein
MDKVKQCATKEGYSSPDELVSHVLDACNHAQFGMFMMAAPLYVHGDYLDAGLLDVAPTLLDLAGHQVPKTMQGQSWLAMPKAGKLCHDTVTEP